MTMTTFIGLKGLNKLWFYLFVKKYLVRREKIKMEQYPTKDLTIDPQVAEDAIKRLAPGAVRKVGVDRLRTVRQILDEYSDCKVDEWRTVLVVRFL